ncbi:MAG: hypothetical protein IKO01_11155 [Kiritimatiellae bacterium]|nr:hypothetical protein [Kiritimatiellia bacterium]
MKASDGGTALPWLRALPVLAALLLLLFSVRTDSLWMDEIQTHTVIQGTFGDLVRELSSRGDAASGMPLYFLGEYAWCRLFGYGEFALRSMNYLAALLVLLGALRLVAAARLPRWSMLFFAANPMFLYYMNEARPYAFLYACGIWGTWFLLRSADAPPGAPARRAVAGFFACWFAACALHMMAVFAGVAYGVFLLLQFRRRPPVFMDHALVWLGAAPCFAALGLYFARFAFGAPELGFPTSPLSGIVQIAYYFAGLGGLGWARNSFREMSIGFSPRAAAELAAAVLAYAAFFACCLRARVWRNRRTIAALACTAAALLVFLAANIALKTRFWERHVIYLVPGLLFALALACGDVLETLPGRFAKAVVFVVLAVNVLSGFNIAVLDEFRKEDYRGAVRLALEDAPDHVFFQGSRLAFRYYGLRGTWSFDIDREETAPIEGNVNISTASWDELRALLARTSGRTRLLLFDRAEYDPAGFHPVLSGLGRHVTGFSVVDAADIPAAALSPESNPMWAGRTHVPTGKWPVFPPAEAAR